MNGADGEEDGYRVNRNDGEAPMDGSPRLYKVWCSAAAVAIGTPLLEIGDTAQLEIVAEVLTSDALQLPAGASVNNGGRIAMTSASSLSSAASAG